MNEPASFEQQFLCRMDVIRGAKQKELIARGDFFLRAGIDNVLSVPLNGDDARARPGPELEFADELARRWRRGSDVHRLQVRACQKVLHRMGLVRFMWRAGCKGFRECDLRFGVNANE